MLVIIRDHVQAVIKNGATLDQVKAARLTGYYDVRFGQTTGPWTTDSSWSRLHEPEESTAKRGYEIALR